MIDHDEPGTATEPGGAIESGASPAPDSAPQPDTRSEPGAGPQPGAAGGLALGAPPTGADPSPGRDARSTRRRGRQPSMTERVATVLGEAAEYVESAASAVGAAVEATARRFEERPGARVRRVRRLAAIPLPSLDLVHPDARNRSRRELGVRTIDVADVVGTAVGGAQQRGSDFLPLKPFRSDNWAARWQRLGQAADRLAILPPIDVLRYDDGYWVLDGHNRVALALYRGQAGIDADVTELVDPAGPRAAAAEPSESFESFIEDSRELRAAVSRTRPRTGGSGR